MEITIVNQQTGVKARVSRELVLLTGIKLTENQTIAQSPSELWVKLVQAEIRQNIDAIKKAR